MANIALVGATGNIGTRILNEALARGHRVTGTTRDAAKLPAVDGLTDQLMALLIELRAESRRTKNFAVADQIRKGLTALKITLEDRPDGTKWRRET